MTGKDLFIALGNVSLKYYDEAENDTIVSETRHRTLRRPLLIAAIIALTALLVGCGVMVAKRMLNWTPEMQEYLTPYNEETTPGAVARDWYIEDVDIYLSIDQPESSVLPISAETWTAEAEGTLEVGTEYWIEKWNGATYQEIHTLDGKPWLVPTQTIACNGEFSWTADYSQSYGQLEPGYYRLGMMISLIPPTGERTEMGCYAKFQIYTKDIKPYVDTYVSALNALLNGDTFHIRVREQYGKDAKASDKYNITEIWKAGQDYFQHSVTYFTDDTFCWDWGDLLRNGAGYTLTFGSTEADANPETVKSVQYLEPFNFTLHLSEFDFFKTGVDSVTADGDRLIFIKDEEYATDTYFGVRRVEVRYGTTGSIAQLSFVDEEFGRTIEVEVIEDSPEAISSWIESIDVVSPRSFSYAKEMEALAHLSYEKIESGFQNASPVSSLSRDAVLEKANAECTRADYNVYGISYDQESKMWKVEFGISWDSYYYEVIYINNNGMTQLVATRPYPEAGEELLPKPSEYP